MSTHPETSGVTLSPDARTGFAIASALETLGPDIVRSLIEIVVAVAADTHIWHWGDGQGGAIHMMLDEIAAEHGLLDVRDTQHTPRKIVDMLSDRDGWDCTYCGQYLHGGPFSLPAPHIDHILPKSRGGSDRLDNLVLACPTCNCRKGALTPEEWERE